MTADRISLCMVALNKGQKADCGSYKTGIVCAVDTIKKISESLSIPMENVRGIRDIVDYIAEYLKINVQFLFADLN